MTVQIPRARIVLLAMLVLPLPAGAWDNSLKPAGKTAPPLTIVADGTPRYAILLPAKPTAPEQKAAADLQQWLKDMTGTALPVAPEDRKPDGVSRFISLGNTDFLKQSRASDDKDLGDEGYEIAVAG